MVAAAGMAGQLDHSAGPAGGPGHPADHGHPLRRPAVGPFNRAVDHRAGPVFLRLDLPVRGPSPGGGMAGQPGPQDVDDDSGQLVLINQHLAGRCETLELFDFDIENGLTPAGYCRLAHTKYAWGLAIIEDGDPDPWTFTSYVTGIGDFEPPHTIDEY